MPFNMDHVEKWLRHVWWVLSWVLPPLLLAVWLLLWGGEEPAGGSEQGCRSVWIAWFTSSWLLALASFLAGFALCNYTQTPAVPDSPKSPEASQPTAVVAKVQETHPRQGSQIVPPDRSLGSVTLPSSSSSSGSEDDIPMVKERLMRIVIEFLTVKSLVLNVKYSDTIETVKAKIEDKEHIPPSNQELFFNDRPLDDSRRTLASYMICEESVLQLKIHKDIQIFIKCLTGKMFTLVVRPSLHTLEDLKNMIEDKAQIAVNQQRITYAGRQLNGCHKLLHYGIVNESTLHLVMKLRSCIECPSHSADQC